MQKRNTNSMKDPRDYFTREEFDKLITTIQLSNRRTKTRDVLLFRSLFSTGARTSELLQLTRHDLHINLNKLSMPSLKKRDKTAIKMVDCNKELIADLKTYSDTLSNKHATEGLPYLFYSKRNKLGRLSCRRVEQILDYYCKKGGMALLGVRKPHPHAFRHSCAIEMLDAGADVRMVMEQLGHSDINSTMTYLQHSNKARREVYDRAMGGV